MIYLAGLVLMILVTVILGGALVGSCYLAQELRCWRCGGQHSCGCRRPPPSV